MNELNWSDVPATKSAASRELNAARRTVHRSVAITDADDDDDEDEDDDNDDDDDDDVLLDADTTVSSLLSIPRLSAH